MIVRVATSGFPVLLTLCLIVSACTTGETPAPTSPRLANLPPIILWAWERPEDLEFIDPAKFGVAFLSQTLVLRGEEVIFEPRRQELNVPPGTWLIAVTRIESRKHSGERVSLSEEQVSKITDLVIRTLQLPGIAGIQIDFDVVVSEREFYRSLLASLRSKLPETVPLSITALASFCLGDRWMSGLKIDEAVPMLFRMGEGSDSIKSHLKEGADLREPLCRTSYGISLDEPLDLKFDSLRRIYLFNPRPWKETDLQDLESQLGR